MAVSKLSPSPNYIITEPHLVRLLGMTAAALLCSIHYWLQRERGGVVHENVKYVYNTATEWGKQLGVSSRQIERAVANLKKLGLIKVEKLARHKSIRTNHYAINYDILKAIVEKNSPNMSESFRQYDGMVNTKNTDTKKNNKSLKSGNTSSELVSGNIVNLPKEGHHTDDHKLIVSLSSTDKAQLEDRESVSISSSVSSRSSESNDKDFYSEHSPKVDNNKCDIFKKSRNTLVQEMLNIWKNSFPEDIVNLNREIAKQLHAAFNIKFNKDISLWRHYCLTIASSPFLTSKKFLLTLTWAIKFKTINRIKDGDLGVKKIPIPGMIEKLETTIRDEINKINESETCKKMRIFLLRRYGAHAYNAWLRKTHLFEKDNYILYKAASAYAQDFIENHFGRLIKPCRQEKQMFETQIKDQLAQEALLAEISTLDEPEKCLQTRRMLLSLLGKQNYKVYIHKLNFFLINGEVQYTSKDENLLNKARLILLQKRISA